jgi:hypothetical protein
MQFEFNGEAVLRRDNAQRCPASKARPLLLSFLYASANINYEE